MKIKIKSRALAAFIVLKTHSPCEVKAQGFYFDSSDGVKISGKCLAEWDRLFAISDQSRFNALIRNLGDEQRHLKHKNEGL